jgi:succinoglycan biosynthesis protein ExoH
MMYVHVHPDIANVRAEVTEPMFWIKFFLVDLVGNASVPALTLISGFLMAFSLQRSGALNINKNRLMTILVPMVTWNLIAILLCLLIYAVSRHPTVLYTNLQRMDLLSIVGFKILALDNQGATPALNFLRDLFVCGLLIKPLLWGVQRGGIRFVALVWVFGLFMGFAPLIFRASIPLFFTLGIYLAIRRGHLRYNAFLTAATLVSFLGVVVADYYGGVHPDVYGQHLHSIYLAFRRIALASALLAASHFIVSCKWAGLLLNAERHVFLVYLTHSVVLFIAWGVWRELFGATLGSAYSVFFIAGPLLVFAVVPLFAPWLDACPGWLQVAVRGRASGRPDAAARTDTSRELTGW